MNTLKLLCAIKGLLPNNYLFFTVFIIIQLKGALILSIVTQSFNHHSENLYISIIKTLFFFELFAKSISNTNYNVICYFIYIAILFTIVFFFITKFIQSQTHSIVNSTITQFRKTTSTSIMISSLSLTFIAFMANYMIEILSLPILLAIIKLTSLESYIKPLYLNKLSNDFASSLYISQYFYLVINIVCIIVLNVFLFFYMKLLNNIHLSDKRIISFSPFNIVIMILVISNNLPIIHYYRHIFINERICAIVLNIISFVYSLLALIINVYIISTDHYCNLIIQGVYIYSFSGSVISLILNCSIQNSTNINGTLIFFQFVFQIIATVFSLIILSYSKKAIFDRKIPNLLFKANHLTSYDYISEFMMLLGKSFHDTYYFSHFLTLLLKHQDSCLITKCDCGIVDVNEMKNMLKGLESKIINDPCVLHSSFEKIILIIENDIINYISSLAQKRILSSNLQVIVYHCCFSFFFKRNHIYTLYLIKEYMNNIPFKSFEYKVYLKLLKKKVIKNYYKTKINYRSSNSFIVKCEKFINYFEKILSIHLNMTNACVFFSQILVSKRLLSSINNGSSDSNRIGSTSIRNSNATTITQLLFRNCDKLEKNIQKISELLIMNYNEDDSNDTLPMRNPEMCYLLSHFFDIIYKFIPNNIIKTFDYTFSYDSVKEHNTYFSDIKFDQPMIISVKSSSSMNRSNGNSNDNNGNGGGNSNSYYNYNNSHYGHYENSKKRNSFIIDYASQHLIDALGYTKEEIILNEMHLLLPELLAERHAEMIQRSIFLHKIIQNENVFFIVDKNKYLRYANAKLGLLPSINNDILVILNLNLIDNNEDDEDNGSTFNFVLDTHFNIMSFTENFAMKYHLTYDLIKKYNLSLCSLFGINNDKVISMFKEKINQIQNVTAFSLDKYLNIVSSCKLKEFIDMTILNKKIALIPDTNNTFIFAKEKKDIKRNLNAIIKEMEDKEFDVFTTNHLKELKNLIGKESHINNNYFLSFEIIIKHMGNYPYFCVTIRDNDPNEKKILRNVSTSLESMNKRNTKDIYTNTTNTTNNNNNSSMNNTYENNSRHINHTSSRKINLWKTLQSDSQLLKSSYINDTTDLINNQSSIFLPLQDQVSNKQFKKTFKVRQTTINKLNIIKATYKNIFDLDSIYINALDKALLYLLYLFSLCIIACYFIQTFTRFSQYCNLESISSLNTQVILLKQMFYDTASYYTSLCFRQDNLEEEYMFNITVTEDYLLEQLAQNSKSMFTYLNELTKYTNKIPEGFEDGGRMVYLFNKAFPYYRLRRNWMIDTLMLSVETEINYLHFHMGMMSVEKVHQCRVKNKFFSFDFEKNLLKAQDNSKADSNNREDESDDATVEESMLFGLIYNGLPSLSETLDVLIVEATKLQRNYREESQSHFELMSFIFISLMLIEILLFFFIVVSFHKKLKLLLHIFLLENPNINYVEMKVNLFLGMLNSFDEEICTSFESTIFNSYHKAGENKEGNDDRTRSITQNQTTSTKNLKTSNSLKLQKKDKTTKDKSSKDTEEDQIRKRNNKGTAITIKLPILLVNYSLIIIYSIAFLIISISCIVFDLNNLTDLKLTIEIGRIYLCSVPRFNEIILYYKYSVLINDTLYCSLDPENYQYYDYTLSEYFTPSANYQNDTKFLKLGKSKMAFLMKKHYEDLEILKKYNQNSELKVLPSSRDFQNEVSCETMIDAFIECCSENIRQELIDNLIMNCREIKNGILFNSGLQMSLENSAGAVIDLYIDFATGNRTKKDMEHFLTHPDYLLAVYLMQNIYVFKLNATGKLVLKDIANFFASIKKLSFIFVVLTAIVAFVIVLSFLTVLYTKIVSFFNNFKEIVHNIEVALIDDSSLE